MWRRIAQAAALLVVLGGRTAVAGPMADPQSSRSRVDLRVVPAEVTQQLTLKDDSRLYGRIESIADDQVVFRTIGGVVLTVARADIADLRVVQGRVVQGAFQPLDPHTTRLFFAPTARSLKRGEGYVGVYEVFLPFVQVGVTNRFSVGGGTPLVFVGGFHPLWITPKLQVVARDAVQAAVGVIHITGLGQEHDAGIAYGVTTVGPPEQSATVGLGYAYSGDHRTAIVMLGGEARTGRHVKWMTENWFWPGGPGFVSGGMRFIGERLSADIAVVVPLISNTTPLPLVSFAWHF